MFFIIATLTLSLVFVSTAARPAAADHADHFSVADLRREPPRPSGAGARDHLEEAFSALADAEAARDRGATITSQRQALRTAAEGIFDWREMAQDALRQHWPSMTPPQRDHFARLLAQLFERLYLPIVERTGASKAAAGIERSIVYVGETVRGDDTVVRTRWRRPARDVAVDWSMRRRAGAWRIRDIAIDGISVVDNYRAQIDHVIHQSSYGDLVARMEAKVHSAPLTAGPPPAMTARLTPNPRAALSARESP